MGKHWKPNKMASISNNYISYIISFLFFSICCLQPPSSSSISYELQKWRTKITGHWAAHDSKDVGLQQPQYLSQPTRWNPPHALSVGSNGWTWAWYLYLRFYSDEHILDRIQPMPSMSYSFLENHYALITNLFRWRRGLADSSDCPLCGREEEYVIYLMQDNTLGRSV